MSDFLGTLKETLHFCILAGVCVVSGGASIGLAVLAFRIMSGQ